MTKELQQWEDDGGAAIVAITRREQRQYDEGPQSDQYAIQSQKVRGAK